MWVEKCMNLGGGETSIRFDHLRSVSSVNFLTHYYVLKLLKFSTVQFDQLCVCDAFWNYSQTFADPIRIAYLQPARGVRPELPEGAAHRSVHHQNPHERGQPQQWSGTDSFVFWWERERERVFANSMWFSRGFNRVKDVCWHIILEVFQKKHSIWDRRFS